MISRLNAGMTANMPLMQVLVPLSPLLGLIGTVSGMLQVFDSMALRGSADARAMASGVSEAMICTMTGLAVSITGLYPVYYFQNAHAGWRPSCSRTSWCSEMRLRRHFDLEESTGIDLAPMLDFVINLLIFFIITAVFVKELGFQVKRHGGGAGGPSTRQGHGQHLRRRSRRRVTSIVTTALVDVRAVRAERRAPARAASPSAA